MTRHCKKDHTRPHPGSGGGKTSIAGPVLDRLIMEKMTRTRECDGMSALPVTRLHGRSQGANWRVPGFVGDMNRLASCEAAIRDYLEFLAAQFDLADD